MIRAGRQHLARTQADLAERAGVSLGYFRNAKLHRRAGHPPPITSPKSRYLLWDGEQTDAFYEGEPVPTLPAEDHEDDLLDRYEAADLAGVKVTTWDRYANLVGMERRPKPVTVAGVEHFRRGDVRAWLSNRTGPGSAGGRKTGSTGRVPLSEIKPRAARALEEDPGIGAAAAADRIGVGVAAAQRALASARADLVEQELRSRPSASVEELADRCGFPPWAARRALQTVAARRRTEEALPYLEDVREKLAAAGVPVGELVVRARPGNAAAALLELGAGAPEQLLVWDERYGWRTAVKRPAWNRAESSPPEGRGIRYLSTGVAPSAANLLAQLADRRTGARHPRLVRDVQADDLAKYLP